LQRITIKSYRQTNNTTYNNKTIRTPQETQPKGSAGETRLTSVT